MKIYLAGKWQDRKRIAQLSKDLIELGHSITWPWFIKESRNSVGSLCAIRDIRGVREADTCIFLFDVPIARKGKGTFSELGMAIALNKRVIVVGKHGDKCVFMDYPLNERYPDWKTALKKL
jgi:nucleoside 2-deoxyribosyltransferase